jgi:hypothetical protein
MPTGPEPAPPPPPPVVRNQLCWPGDRRWNKTQLLTPLMSRFDVLTMLVTRARANLARASEPFAVSNFVANFVVVA